MRPQCSVPQSVRLSEDGETLLHVCLSVFDGRDQSVEVTVVSVQPNWLYK